MKLSPVTLFLTAALLTQCGGEQGDEVVSPPADIPTPGAQAPTVPDQDPAARAAELTVKKVNGTATDAEIEELERYISGE